jgi:small subunit ribosomal protein S21
MARKKHGNRLEGLQVKVFNNNVEGALKKLKRKIKDSEMMLELKKRSFYKKPSELKREKRNLARLRQQYKSKKENNFE